MRYKVTVIWLLAMGMVLAACNNGSGEETAVLPASTSVAQAVIVATADPTPTSQPEPTSTQVIVAEAEVEPSIEPVDEAVESITEEVAVGESAAEEPTPTLPLVVAEPGERVMEEVSFTAVDGLEIQATFFGSLDGPAQPGVILLHMLGDSRYVWERNEVAALLADNGYAVLTVDMRGHGTTRGVEDWAAGASDLQQIWSEFVAWEGVDAERTAVVGASIGSTMALITGDNHPAISTVVLLSPGLQYLGVSLDERIMAYGERPILIVASEEDAYSADSSRTLYDMAQGEAELIMFDGAGHGTQMFRAEPSLATSILAWLDAYLGGGETAVSGESVVSQEVAFATADERNLQGILFGDGNKGVIFANMNDNQSLPWQSFAQEVAAEGYMTLIFNYRSAGRFDMGERDDDLLAAAHFMQEQGAESLVIIGASIGGTATAVVAAEHQDALNLQGITIIASPAGVPDLIASDEMIQAITVPKLFITTEDDVQGLAPSARRMFETAVEPKEFQTYPGTAHGVDIFATDSNLAFRRRLLQFVQMVMPIAE